MNKKILKSEIRENVKEVYHRVFYILPRLLSRYMFGRNLRTAHTSYPEYDSYWNSYWESKDIFRKDLVFTRYDKICSSITPFELRKQCIIKTLAEKITKHKILKVLEIGSGAGHNMMLLAPKFPDVSFFGLEPTRSGVEMTNKFINSPPKEFEEAYNLGKLNNVQIIRGSVLDAGLVESLKDNGFDLVFTSAVLEQLNNYLDESFINIFKLGRKYFLFNEEFLEANYLIENYKMLVDSDYFRVSWNYLNKFENFRTIDRTIHALQPSWLKYAVVFGEKIDDSREKGHNPSHQNETNR